MAIAIIGAMDPEIAILKNLMTDTTTHNIGNHEIIEGKLDGKDVILAKSGIGKVCAASITAILLSKFDVSCVINTGSAGAIDPALNVGDVVFSRKVAYHDVDVTAFDYKRGQLPGYEQYFIASERVVNIAKEAALDVDGIEIHLGDVLSGDQFIADKEITRGFKKDFSNALVCEMEGAAVAQVCTDFKVDFLVIRSASDKANSDSPMSFDEFLPMASKNSSLLVRALINKL